MKNSNNRRCLLCLTKCLSAFDGDQQEDVCETTTGYGERSGRLLMAGAVECCQLRQQLEKVFVIRRILDIPVSWCEEVLKNNCNKEGDSKINSDSNGGNPANWFVLCRQCMDSSVNQVWKVYQQITALEIKMREVKKQVKGRMLKEIKRLQNRGGMWSLKQGEQNSVGVEGRIFNFLFPELIRESENEVDEHFIAVNVNDDLGIKLDFEDDSTSNYSDNLSMDDDLKPTMDVSRPEKTKVNKSLAKKNNCGMAKKPVKFHKNEFRSKGIWYSCLDNKCRARYRTRKDLEAHSQAHKEREKNGKEKTELDCPHCAFPARDSMELGMHIELRHRLQNRSYYFPCPKCDFKAEKDFSSLKAHFDTEHLSNDQSQVLASDQPQQCSACSKRCESLKSFVIHQRSCHPEQVGMQIETSECNQCGMKFSTKQDLQNHVRRKHTQPKWQSKFVCEECGEGFQQQNRLDYHKIKHQNKLKRDFVCHLCGLDYAYKWLLEDHYRKIHPPSAQEDQHGKVSGGTAEKKINCKYCEFTCTIKGIMIRHLQQHKEEIGFKCDQCGKSYVNLAGLRRHRRIIHFDGVYQCPYCVKPFKSLEYWRRHLKVACKVRKIQEKSSSSTSDSV